MIVTRVSTMTMTAVAAAGLLLPAAGLSAPAANAVPVSPCAPAGPFDLAPAQSCEDQREQCFAGSAQETTFGGRYVPTEVVAMCMDVYRACINENTDS